MPYKDREQQRQFQSAWHKQRFSEKRQLVQAAKVSGCERCGETDAVCLDFHHRSPDEKLFTVSEGTTRSLEAIKAEIEKCVVLCRNCHAKVHAGRFTL
jgi:hypothetical protein